MDFNEMSWQRGDLSFVFNGENQNSGELMYIYDVRTSVVRGYVSVCVVCMLYICMYVQLQNPTIILAHHNVLCKHLQIKTSSW